MFKINPLHTCSIDIETHLYFDNKRVSSYKEFRDICENKIQHLDEETKKHLSTTPWCFCLYEDTNGFQVFQSWDDVMDFLVESENYLIWDFNLKFDGSFLDYIFYHNKNYSYENKTAKYYYETLVSDNGNRYFINITHKKRLYKICDFNNIVRTSIKGLAKMFNIVVNNEKIEKTTMDYYAVTWNDINKPLVKQYLFNDVYILFKGVLRTEYFLKQIAKEVTLLYQKNFNQLGLTIASIAKKQLLINFYNLPYKKALVKFWHNHLITDKLDEVYRNCNLYGGGYSAPNPYKTGNLIKGPIYYYDINSAYPARSFFKKEIKGKPNVVHFKDKEEFKNFISDFDLDKYCLIVRLKYLDLDIKPNGIPVFTYLGKPVYKKRIEQQLGFDNYPFMFFYEYLKTLELHYKIDYEVDLAHYYLYGDCVYQKFMDKYYSLKSNSKGEIKAVAKIILNAATGKLGQKIKVVDMIYDYDKEKDVVGFTYKKNKNGERDFKIELKNKLDVKEIAQITSLERMELFTKMQLKNDNNARFYHLSSDTDSCQTLFKWKNEDDIDDKKLGCWKLECVGEYAKFLKPKTYLIYIKENNQFKIACKGLKKSDLVEQLMNDGKLIKANNFQEHFDAVEKMKRQPLTNKKIKKIFELFDYNKFYYSTSSVLVRGGRILLLIKKALALKGTEDEYEAEIF